MPEYPLHAVIRGNNRNLVFRSEGDRLYFHRLLTESAQKFGTQVHAYVFMPNHVHLLASGLRVESLSKTIQSVGRRYVAYFNLVYKRTGTLWEGRFHSSLVDTDRYLLACQRYIELNPVRAGICGHPSEFQWSSYRHYAQGVPDDLVTPHSLHQVQFRGPAEYCRIFDRDVPKQTVHAIRDALHHGWVLGDPEFRKRIASISGRRAERLSTAGRPSKPGLVEMESDPIIAT